MTAPFDPRDFVGAEALGPAPPAPPALAELLSALRRRWLWVALAGVTAAVVAAAALARAPAPFVATAEVLLEAVRPQVAPFETLSPAAALDAQAVASEIRVVQSQALLTRVVRKLRLAEDAAFGAAPAPGALAQVRAAARAWASGALGWAPAAAPVPEDTGRARELRAVAALAAALTVARRDESRVLAVAVEDASAERAALLANAVADEYLVDRLEARFEATERGALWLSERLAETAARLEEAERAAEAARARAAADPAGALVATRRRLAETAAAMASAEGARWQALAGAAAALEAEAAAQAAREIALRRTEREVEALAALHGAFLARLEEARAEPGLERPDARVIAEAVPPAAPERARAGLVLALATAAGLAFGAAAAFAAESAGGVHHSAEAVERETGLPVLAALPRVAARDPAAAARARPASRLAEAVREVRGAVLADAEAGRGTVIAVLSAGPGEGKSALAAMLAESCARLGRATVLVDADLRNPAQAGRWGLSGEEDFGALLEGRAVLDEVLWQDPETGLWLLPAQPAPARGAELLAGPALPAALAALAARFEVVVLDGPPLLAVADARILAEAADRSVLALRWGRTPRAELRAALAAMGPARARVAGVALTATPPARDPRPGRDGRGGRYGRFAEYFEE